MGNDAGEKQSIIHITSEVESVNDYDGNEEWDGVVMEELNKRKKKRKENQVLKEEAVENEEIMENKETVEYEETLSNFKHDYDLNDEKSDLDIGDGGISLEIETEIDSEKEPEKEPEKESEKEPEMELEVKPKIESNTNLKIGTSKLPPTTNQSKFVTTVC